LPPLLPQHWPGYPPPALPAPAIPVKQSSPPAPENPQDLLNYVAWFKQREPHNAGKIKSVMATLQEEKDSLNTLESISEDRVARQKLPAGLVTRMKVNVKL
jgi:hypothetical protein